MIEEYSFGRLLFNGKTYTRDVIIFENKVFYREVENHHFFSLNEITALFKRFSFDTLVIGTGYYNVAKVMPEVDGFCLKHGIHFIKASSIEAKNIFNELINSNKKVLGVIHLTC